jgi:hypothetical protein
LLSQTDQEENTGCFHHFADYFTYMSRLPLFAQEVKLRRGGDVAMIDGEEGGGE